MQEFKSSFKTVENKIAFSIFNIFYPLQKKFKKIFLIRGIKKDSFYRLHFIDMWTRSLGSK